MISLRRRESNIVNTQDDVSGERTATRARRSCVCARTSEDKDSGQNTNLHRPLMDMGMLEKNQII
jgi:hypothetical protein